MIIAGLQAQPNTGLSQVQEQKQEEPAFVTPSFLQPPGREQSQAEIDSKKKAAEAAQKKEDIEESKTETKVKTKEADKKKAHAASKKKTKRKVTLKSKVSLNLTT